MKGCHICGLICISDGAAACQDCSEDAQYAFAVKRAVVCKLLN